MKNLKFEKVSNELTKEEMYSLKGGTSGSGGTGGGGTADYDTWVEKEKAWQNDKDAAA